VKISIKQDSSIPETEITIVCKVIDEELAAVISSLSLIDNTVAGKIGNETFFIPLIDVLYFESVDNRTFFYTQDKTYESGMKLYQLEEKLSNTPFVRVSKSALLNIKMVKSIQPEGNSRLIATLKNGERLMVSRQYLKI
jgi:DNA-binding LytR/AlgR family response regulator